MKKIILTFLFLIFLQGICFAQNIKFVQVTDAHFIAGDEYRTEVLKNTVKTINKEKD